MMHVRTMNSVVLSEHGCVFCVVVMAFSKRGWSQFGGMCQSGLVCNSNSKTVL